MLVHRSRGWEIPGRLATPEPVYRNRRAFLCAAGLAGAGVIAAGCRSPADTSDGLGLRGDGAVEAALRAHPGTYPAGRNPAFTLDRPLTDRSIATTFNNFYEFTNDKPRVVVESQKLTLRPWAVEIDGLVERPMTVDVDDLVRRFSLEERLYRHRCVEAWAMAVPWTGFPMHQLLSMARPLSAARYVRFVTFLRPEEAVAQRTDTWYPWPYYEGLTLAEAVNELTLLVTGIYGKPLPPQNGAPIRVVTPWKYGYKSIKSIVRIELVKDRPPTFWNDQQPDEYSFTSNVDPTVAHSRWSQARERLLGTDEMRDTLAYNGYGEWVAGLY
jgi:sulfoxide reductase catalytic subunit YedY